MGSRLVPVSDERLIAAIKGNAVDKDEYAFQSFICKDENASRLLPVYDMEGVESYRLKYICKEVDTGYGNLDGLFIDEFGIFTLLEVKRSRDSRARRAVITQILDYANGISRMGFDELCKRIWIRTERYPDEGFISGSENLLVKEWFEYFYSSQKGYRVDDTTHYQRKVKANLEKGYLRLCIAADRIDQSLLDLASYMSMGNPSFRIGLFELTIEELDDKKYFVPHVKHSSARFPSDAYAFPVDFCKKRVKLTRDEFYMRLKERAGQEAVDTAKEVCSRLEEGSAFFFTKPREGSISVRFTFQSKDYTLLNIYIDGNVVPGWVDHLTNKPDYFQRAFKNFIVSTAGIFGLGLRDDRAYWEQGQHTTLKHVKPKLNELLDVAANFKDSLTVSQ